MIKSLSNEMNQFLRDIKENIKNPEELSYILKRTENFFDAVIKEVEEIMKYKEKEFKKLEKKQKDQDKEINEMQEKVRDLYKDIYDEEYGDFEIICPYCNYLFNADIDESNKEIICPECNNIIELDWDEEN